MNEFSFELDTETAEFSVLDQPIIEWVGLIVINTPDKIIKRRVFTVYDKSMAYQLLETCKLIGKLIRLHVTGQDNA